MSPDESESWAAGLRQDYRASLSGKLANLEALCEAARARQADAAALAALVTAVHRIKGSAASYGFDEIGVVAAEWDLALKPAAARGSGFTPEESAATEEFLQRFREAVDRAKAL